MFDRLFCPINRNYFVSTIGTYLRILTDDEVAKFVSYLKNKNRCAQGLTQTEANEIVLNILKAKKDLNREGGRKFIKLK